MIIRSCLTNDIRVFDSVLSTSKTFTARYIEEQGNSLSLFE